MIIYKCDWCDEQITGNDMFERGGPDNFVVKRASDTTKKRVAIEFIVSTDGVANEGQYHKGCILRILARVESEYRQAGRASV